MQALTFFSDEVEADGPMERHGNIYKHCLKLAEIGLISEEKYDFALKVINEAMQRLLTDDMTCKDSEPKVVSSEGMVNHSMVDMAINVNEDMDSEDYGIHNPMQVREVVVNYPPFEFFQHTGQSEPNSVSYHQSGSHWNFQQSSQEAQLQRLPRGSRPWWSLIAGRLPGRTDNEIKNYWNTHLSKTIIRQGNGQEQHNQNQKYQMEYLKTEKPVPILIETSNVVVRTKARRCTGNVFITPSQEEEPCENAETNKGGSETAQYAEVADHMDSMKAPDQFINADHEIESWWDALMDFNVNVNDCNWMDESPPVHNAAEGGEHDQVVMLESEMDETRNPPVFDLDLNDLSAFLNWEGGEL
ncbi:hypothetical protein J5N97_005968 [Dioscorea zingiberensis]|uniref:Uncharacterized protein n=1 Tax=Dioscorea zingiberensis TaxID=325984 RepID=A0A9D5DBK6_9LILI|nr:hypothetical protein J5N97_005968 [Dioscorea zingiberensis]